MKLKSVIPFNFHLKTMFEVSKLIFFLKVQLDNFDVDLKSI